MRLILTIAATLAALTLIPAASSSPATFRLLEVANLSDCKGKAFPWGGQCWSRFDGDQFSAWLRKRNVNPHVFAQNWPQLAQVFRQPWPGPKPWSEQWLLDRVNAAWPDVAAWTRIAICETGGDWQWNSGTYQGGVGFYWGTWDGWNDYGFPSEAYLATPGQQMLVADNLYSDLGLSGWGCRGAA